MVKEARRNPEAHEQTARSAGDDRRALDPLPAQHGLVADRDGERARRRYAEMMERLAGEVLPHRRADDRASVAEAREGREAGAFDLPLQRAVRRRDLPERDRAPVAQPAARTSRTGALCVDGGPGGRLAATAAARGQREKLRTGELRRTRSDSSATSAEAWSSRAPVIGVGSRCSTKRSPSAAYPGATVRDSRERGRRRQRRSRSASNRAAADGVALGGSVGGCCSPGSPGAASSGTRGSTARRADRPQLARQSVGTDGSPSLRAATLR